MKNKSIDELIQILSDARNGKKSSMYKENYDKALKYRIIEKEALLLIDKKIKERDSKFNTILGKSNE